MIVKIKLLFLLLFFVSFSYISKSNSAQPGIWQAGGTGVFRLHYPEDSSGFKKIRMQSEQIYMKLYPGFAVVKGTYIFENTEDTAIHIKIGYPINNVFSGENESRYLNEVILDDLYGIKALWNSEESAPLLDSVDNWYVWKGYFPPKQRTTFTVYFLVTQVSHPLFSGIYII